MKKILETLKRKWTEYLLEIIVIVIGILVAFTLNNWNEDRLIRKNIDVQLVALKEALQDERSFFERSKSLDMFRVHSLQYILRLTGEDEVDFEYQDMKVIEREVSSLWKGTFPEEFDRKFITLAFSWSGRLFTLSSNTIIIDELKSSGIYSNKLTPELKVRIDDYYRESNWRFSLEDDTRIIDKWNDSLKEDGVWPMDIRNVDDPLDLVRNNPYRIVQLKQLIDRANWRAISTEILIGKIDELIPLINKEIAK